MKKEETKQKKEAQSSIQMVLFIPFPGARPFYHSLLQREYKGCVCVCGNEMCMDESGKSDDDVLEGVMCVCVRVCVYICVWQKAENSIRPTSFSSAS